MPKKFYSEREKLAFIVTGYVDEYNSQRQQKMLSKYTRQLSEFTGQDECLIETYPITVSPRYKSMRVFFVNSDVCPKDFLSLNGDWTMQKWLHT